MNFYVFDHGELLMTFDTLEEAENFVEYKECMSLGDWSGLQIIGELSFS